MSSKDVVVLLSGGLDSAIMAAYLLHAGYSIKAGVFVNRGQSNFGKEYVAANKISKRLEIQLHVPEFSVPGARALFSEETLKRSGVPARNLTLASLALPYVYGLGCDMLALGNISTDIFPDSSAMFRQKLSACVSHMFGKYVSVVAPLADWEQWVKGDEIRFAHRNGFSDLFKMSWTCWHGGERHCGVCAACIGRKVGFEIARVADPTTYEESK